MSRTVASAARAALYQESSGYALPILIEITHGVSGYLNPLRLVNNTVNLEYEGNTYIAFPFKFDPPDMKESGEVANGRISICAVTQEIATILRSTSVVPTVKAIAMFWNDDGSTVFEPLAAWEFELRKVSGNNEIISADLVYENRMGFEYPYYNFRPSLFPGVF